VERHIADNAASEFSIKQTRIKKLRQKQSERFRGVTRCGHF